MHTEGQRLYFLYFLPDLLICFKSAAGYFGKMTNGQLCQLAGMMFAYILNETRRPVYTVHTVFVHLSPDACRIISTDDNIMSLCGGR